MQLLRSAGRLIHETALVARTSGPRTGAAYAVAIAKRLPEIVRSRSLVVADVAMRRRPVRFRVLGVNVELPGELFSGAREMYCRKVYFAQRHVTLREGDVVVDLGANMGLFTLLAAIKCQRVIAVDAQSGFRKDIEANLRSNGVLHKAAIEVALVGGGSGVFADANAFRGASHFEGVLPPQLSMPELMERHELSRIDFLKMDIEGSEFDLFRGSTDWLARVDRIAMEVHAQAGSAAELSAILERAGFTTEFRTPDLRVHAPFHADGYLYAYRNAS